MFNWYIQLLKTHDILKPDYGPGVFVNLLIWFVHFATLIVLLKGLVNLPHLIAMYRYWRLKTFFKLDSLIALDLIEFEKQIIDKKIVPIKPIIPYILYKDGNLILRNLRKTLTREYMVSLLDSFSIIYKTDFIDIERRDKIKNEWTIYKNKLPSIIPYDSSENLEGTKLYFSMSNRGEKIFWDYHNNNILRIMSKTGGGKTTAVKTIMSAFLSNVKNPKILICSTKVYKDWPELLQHPDVEILDMSDFDNIELATTRMKEILIELQQNIKNSDRLILLDEAQDYLHKNMGRNKDETAKIDTFVQTVKSVLRKCRMNDIPTILATQDSTEDAVDIPKQSFTSYLVGTQNEAMSRQLSGDSKKLQDSSLTEGRFFFKDKNNEVIVLTRYTESVVFSKR